MEPRMLLQPVMHVVVVVRAVIVQDQMQIQFRRSFPVDLAQKLEELLISVPWIASACDPVPSSTLSAANRQVVPLRL